MLAAVSILQHPNEHPFEFLAREHPAVPANIRVNIPEAGIAITTHCNKLPNAQEHQDAVNPAADNHNPVDF